MSRKKVGGGCHAGKHGRILSLAIYFENFLQTAHTDFTLVEQTQTYQQPSTQPRYKDSYIVSVKLNNHFLVPVRRVAEKRDKTLGSASPFLGNMRGGGGGGPT